MLKQCTKCKRKKKLEEFAKGRAKCRDCVNAYLKEYHKKNREKHLKTCREYYQENREKLLAQKAEYYKENAEKLIAYQEEYRANNVEKLSSWRKEYNEKNRERRSEWASENWKKKKSDPVFQKKRKDYRTRNRKKLKEAHSEWRKNNRQKVRDYSREWQRERSANDPMWKILKNIRGNISKTIRSTKQSDEDVRDLGCSPDRLREHLESMFDDKMTFDNYGTYWEVDHFFPVSKANQEDPVEKMAVCNWRNLQPLTATENRSKGDTVLPEARELFEELKAEFSREAAA